MTDHADVRWPPGTEGLRRCGRHCTKPADPAAATTREALRATLPGHCPCRTCHHAFHHCRGGKTYAWFAGRWAELLTAEVIP